MIDVAVGVDHRNDRLIAAIFVIQIHSDLCGLRRYQRIDNGDAFFAFDNGHVGEIEVADLVNAFGHFKQAANIDQLGLTPEAGVDRIRRLFTLFNKVVLLRVPDNVALFAFNHLRRERGDKAFMRVGKVGVIGEGKLFVQRVVCLFGCRGGCFGRRFRPTGHGEGRNDSCQSQTFHNRC